MVGAGGDEDGEGNGREGGGVTVTQKRFQVIIIGVVMLGGAAAGRGIRPTIKHNACGNVKIRHMADEQNGVRLVGGVMKGLEG